MTTTDRWRAALDRPVDAAWLGALRVLYGLVMAVSMLRFVAYGWVEPLFVRPRFHFSYWGLGWVEVLPPAGMHALFWALLVLALAVALGFWYRASLALFLVGFAYLQAIDVTNYLNHYYLALLLGGLLWLSPAGRVGSLDAWRRGDAVATVPAAWLYLFRFQIAVVYTFAGLAKASEDWLVHAQPLRIWLAARTDFPLIGPLLRLPAAPVLMSWAGFLFDTCIAWFLMWRRTRVLAYVVVIVFHTLTRLLFPIGMFPVIMVLAALVFFEPGWPRRFGRFVGGWPGGAAAAPSWRPGARWLAVAYAAVQLALPMRYLAYGGNVLWHEQGMRFSWRVMVREKNGSVSYVVRRPDTGRVWRVSPRRYLTSLQEREMSSQPDLILQVAHWIRDDFARRGEGAVEVRVEALVSLNGRPGALLVDPARDLAKVEDGVGKADWILPAPSGPPPRLRSI